MIYDDSFFREMGYLVLGGAWDLVVADGFLCIFLDCWQWHVRRLDILWRWRVYDIFPVSFSRQRFCFLFVLGSRLHLLRIHGVSGPFQAVGKYRWGG